MNVLAFDLSLTATGVCLPDGTTHTHEAPSVKGKRTLTDDMTRLQWLVEAIQNDLDLPYGFAASPWPDLVVIEDYSGGGALNSGTKYHLGELHGLVRLSLWNAGIPFLAVSARSVQKFATGRSGATNPDKTKRNVKLAMLDAARKHTDQDFGSDDNRVDAWWLRQLGLYVSCETTPVERGVCRNDHVPVTGYRDDVVNALPPVCVRRAEASAA